MKAISIQQPFASLIVLGLKKIETRSWQTTHRGPLLIHASAGKTYMHLMDDPEFRKHLTPHFMDDPRNIFPFGAIIGQANLDMIFNSEGLHEIMSTNAEIWNIENLKGFDKAYEQELAFGDYSPERFGWYLSDPIIFDKPIPAKGKLSIWEFDESLLNK